MKDKTMEEIKNAEAEKWSNPFWGLQLNKATFE